VRATEAALARAGLAPADVDYVNAHGTGTPLNDPMEARSLARIFGADLSRVLVSSQKGQIGHTLAAAGAIEAVLTALAIARRTIPPTGGLEEPDPALGLTHVTTAIERPIRAAISSSFGFGGMDTVLVFGDREAKAHAPRAPRRVFVTGVATLTPSGLAGGADVARVPACTEETVGIDLDAHLDRDRARRLDRTSRFAAIACARAWGGAVPSDAGIVVGQAFGAVDSTAAFMRRLRDKGPRLVSPADFPSLVPSSPAGHASIYLGLGGPALVVADLATSGECALAQGFELVAAGEVDRLAVVAVEERSAIVEEIFSVLFGRTGARGEPRREGAAAIAIGSGGAGALAEIADVLAWTDASAVALPLQGDAPEGAIVVLAAAGGAAEAVVARSSWASCPRTSCAGAGTHEAAGGIAIAVAAAAIARGEARAALVVGSRSRPGNDPGAGAVSGYAVVLRSCSP
jgi:3-oxoacyl-[acyl-carrier-protein] synthase II